MFLQASVILLMGGCLVPGGVCSQGSACSGGVSARGGVWSWVVPDPGGGAAPGGCLVETPPGTATAAVGTHPTGMHSCTILKWVN